MFLVLATRVQTLFRVVAKMDAQQCQKETPSLSC